MFGCKLVDVLLLESALLDLRSKLLIQLVDMPSLLLSLELELDGQLGDLSRAYSLGLRGLYLEDLELLLKLVEFFVRSLALLS